MVESELREQLETELIIDFHNSVEIGSRVLSLRYVVVSCARYVRNTQSEPSNFDNFQVDQQKGAVTLLRSDRGCYRQCWDSRAPCLILQTTRRADPIVSLQTLQSLNRSLPILQLSAPHRNAKVHKLEKKDLQRRSERVKRKRRRKEVEEMKAMKMERAKAKRNAIEWL